MIAAGRIAGGVLLWAALAARAGSVESWGPETNVSETSTDSETGLGHRPLARTLDGTFHVAWAERDTPNSTYRIWTRRLDGAAWTAPEMIVDYLPEDPGGPGDDIGAKYPSLAATPDGALHLFWHDYRVAGIANVEVFTKVRPPGGPWDPGRAADIRLTTTDHPEVLGDNGYVPVPAVAPGGDLHVLWYDFRWDGVAAEICAKTRPSGGSFDLSPGDGADVRVTEDAAHSELCDAFADGQGNLHAAWRSVDGGARVLYARRDAATESWSTPEAVDGAGTVAGAPCLAVDASDRVHVVWPDSRDGGRALWVRERDAAGGWSAEARLTRPADGADEPSLDASEDGTLHLVWSDGRVSLFNREVFHRDRAPGSPWDTTGAGDSRISVAAGASTRPSVLAESGIVLVSWRDERDGNRELYVRRGQLVASVATSAAGPARMLRIVPNPARGVVRVLRPAGSAGDVEVVDASGRRLRVLHGGAETLWDGCDGAARPVAAGTYFVRERDTGLAARVTVLR
jgi:hypothetical protein